MEKERRDVVRRLFVAATEMLEDQHIIAAAGQRQRAALGTTSALQTASV